MINYIGNTNMHGGMWRFEFKEKIKYIVFYGL